MYSTIPGCLLYLLFVYTHACSSDFVMMIIILMVDNNNMTRHCQLMLNGEHV